MQKTRAQLKQELKEKSETVIEKLLDWNEEHKTPNLTEIEDIVLELREELGLGIAASILANQEKQMPVVEKCKTCGQEMRQKGQKRKVVESRVGEVVLERGYYYCGECGAGIFPLDQQLKVNGGQSEMVSRLSVWLAGLVPFARAAEILEQVGQIRCSRGSVWEQTSQWGAQFQAEEVHAQQRASEIDVKNGVVPGEARESKRLGVSMDGGMIHIRDEGWKETKIGVVFEVKNGLERDEQTGEEVEVGCARELSYAAHLGSPEAFGKKVWAEARRRGWTRAADTQVVGDGAVWIWNLAQEHFYDSQQVVDWYHAKQHLALAAELLHGTGTPAMQRWLSAQETRLFQGHADEIAKLIRQQAQQHAPQDELLREAGYFEHNQHRMDYLEMRIQGWLIGSGMVESGAKQFKARLAGPGMRWSRPGAEKMLAIRTTILSGRFDQTWRHLYYSPQI